MESLSPSQRIRAAGSVSRASRFRDSSFRSRQLSAGGRSRRLSSVSAATSRATRGPKRAESSSRLTPQSSTVSWSTAAARSSGSVLTAAQMAAVSMGWRI